jgi:propionyl-CoA carboxylase alpha chain
VVQSGHGDVELALRPRFEPPGADVVSGGLVAPMPGKVIDVRVRVGDAVRAGDTLVVLEAMKMEHPIRAAEDGVVVELRAVQGEQVENGALLLLVEPTGGASEGDPQQGGA